jgi:hypothetical protein
MMDNIVDIVEVTLPLPPPLPLPMERNDFVYNTKTLTKQQLFDAVFLHAGEMMLEFTSPFRDIPYWIGLAGEVSIDDAVQMWELEHQSIPGPPPDITDELRTIWTKVSRYIIEIHAMAFRCWLKRKLAEDIMNNKYDFITGEGWLDCATAIYFTKDENIQREKQILEFCSSGSFGVYLKTLGEAYDIHKTTNMLSRND